MRAVRSVDAEAAVTWPGGRSHDGGLDEITVPEHVPGRVFLCGKHVVGPDPEGVRQRLGGDVVVVCFNQRADIARYDGYADWLATSPDARWYEIPDLHAPRIDEAIGILDGIVGLLRDGRTVVMHCSAGIGRAGTMAVAVLMALGVPTEEALATVASQRPGAGPEVGAQRDLLDALDSHLAR
ncbi:protein-tyrosine phosphatase family protein [Ilumatobacter sp.]|uniref:protein-tyrosine phosphatase family protein n=1 Tax=Ilumatobacter sp. TaxID=1967498 RepID=UPI003B51ADD8